MDTITRRVKQRETPTPAELRAAPDHAGGYIYRLDPDCDPNGRVPPEKIQGAWAVDAHGKIVGQFQPNPNYRGAFRE